MGQALGFPFDLLPSAAGYAPAVQLQELLTPAIVLEGRVGVVEATAVGLDNQAGVAPKEVRLEPAATDVEGDVDLGRRKPAFAAHAEEHALQFAARPPRLRMKFVKNETKPRNPTTTTAAPKQHAQSSEVDDPQHLGLGERLLQPPHRDDRSQIKQRSLYGRAGDPAHPGRIAR